MNIKRLIKIVGTVIPLVFVFSSVSFAAGTGMPWEGPMATILGSLTGPWLRFGSVISIMVCSMAIAFGEIGGIFKRALQVVLGLSICCAAPGWGLTFFGFGGGLTI